MEFSCSGSAVVRRELQYCMNKVLLFTFPSMLVFIKNPWLILPFGGCSPFILFAFSFFSVLCLFY